MVKKKNSIAAKIQRTSIYKSTKSYFSTAFYSVFTLNPFDITNISFSYFQPLLLITLLSLITLSFSIVKLGLAYFSRDIMETFFGILLSFSAIFACYSIYVFIYSFFGCRILNIDYNHKHYGIISSSLIPIPFLLLAYSFKIAQLNLVVFLAIHLMMCYYIKITYQRWFDMGSDRTRFLFEIYIFIFYVLLLSLVIGLVFFTIPPKLCGI